MLLLGLLLFAAAGAFAGLLVAQNPAGPDVTVSLFHIRLGRLDTTQAFLAGIALALVCCLGFALVSGSVRRMHRRRAARLREQREAQWLHAERIGHVANFGALAPFDQEADELDRTEPLVPLSSLLVEPSDTQIRRW